MLIAGVEIAPHHIVSLADELIAAGHPGTAATLLHADAKQSIALTALDREALLQVLEELGELRAHSWIKTSGETSSDAACDLPGTPGSR